MDGRMNPGQPAVRIVVTPPTPSPTCSDSDEEDSHRLPRQPRAIKPTTDDAHQDNNNDKDSHPDQNCHPSAQVTPNHAITSQQSVSSNSFSPELRDLINSQQQQQYRDRSPSPAEDAFDALMEFGGDMDLSGMQNYPAQLDVTTLTQNTDLSRRQQAYSNTSQLPTFDGNMNTSSQPKIVNQETHHDNTTSPISPAFNDTANSPSLFIDLSVAQPQTSTPVISRTSQSMADESVRPHLSTPTEASSRHSPNQSSSVLPNESISRQSGVLSQSTESFSDELDAPIVGYEVMEQRARFTLKDLFPYFRLALPPKKYFGDNFDDYFLKERIIRLQAFINNIIGHRDACQSRPVRDFFCFDDPPGPHDSLEESRALCDSLEEQIYGLKHELRDRDSKIELLEAEVSVQRMEIENLRKSLRDECKKCSKVQLEQRVLHMDHVISLVALRLIERAINSKRRHSPPTGSDDTIIEQDESSCTEADQAQAREQVKGQTSETKQSTNVSINDLIVEAEVRKIEERIYSLVESDTSALIDNEEGATAW